MRLYDDPFLVMMNATNSIYASDYHFDPSLLHPLPGQAKYLGGLIILSVLALLTLSSKQLSKKSSGGRSGHEVPTFHFPQDDLANNGREIYRRLLRDHGPVVCVPRCGRNEYLLHGQYAKRLFTEHDTFLFEPAILSLLNMDWAMSATSAHSNVAKLSSFIQQSMQYLPEIVDRMAPIIFKRAEQLAGDKEHHVEADIYSWAHTSIAQATVSFVYGEEYLDDNRVAEILEATAVSIRKVSGVDRATSWMAKRLPSVWKYGTMLNEFFFSLLPRYYLQLLPILWHNRERHLYDSADHQHDGFVPVYSKVSQHFCANKQSMDLRTFINFNTTIMLGMAFGSIHQSANNGVWVLFYLAQRPDCMRRIREELQSLVQQQTSQTDYPTADTLHKAVFFDSFVNEVMRTKGDTYGPPRELARDTRIGQYIVPKGANLQVILFTQHENGDLFDDPLTFDSERALRASKPAHMASENYLTFGLSRWACPGRFLAVAEMKLLVASLLYSYDVRLENDTYSVRDPITTTAVAPIGTLLLDRRQSSSYL